MESQREHAVNIHPAEDDIDKVAAHFPHHHYDKYKVDTAFGHFCVLGQRYCDLARYFGKMHEYPQARDILKGRCCAEKCGIQGA